MGHDSTRYRIVRIGGQPARYLRRLPRPQQEAIAGAFEYLEQSPLSHPNPTAIKPLKGKLRGLLRFRVGDLRIVYDVSEERHEISILAIQPRGEIYK